MTRTRCSGYGVIPAALAALVICCILTAAPVSAATRYLGDGPSFTAVLTGNNEFVPGQDAMITILVKNTGLNDMKQVAQGTIEPEDQQNTAKTVTIGLASAGDAILIRTDPQPVGDIRGGNSITVQFRAKISSNATEGEYRLPLSLRYRYPDMIVQEAAHAFEFTYNEAEVTLPVTIRIQPHVKAEVIEAVPEGLSVGSEGYLDLKIRNIGSENGTMASIKLLRNGQSPIIPTDSTLFIGDFPRGSVASGRFRISVSKDSTNQSYPVDLVVSSANREGRIVTSSPVTIGVPVNAKPAFTVISPLPEVERGAKRTIEVRYRNDGDLTVHAAQARLTLHAPVTPGDDTAYLGDIAPGDSAAAQYDITADDAAEPMVYSFESTLRFRDALGTSQESDPIPVQISVVPASGFVGYLLPAGGFLAVIIAGVAVLVCRQKKKTP